MGLIFGAFSAFRPLDETIIADAENYCRVLKKRTCHQICGENFRICAIDCDIEPVQVNGDCFFATGMDIIRDFSDLKSCKDSFIAGHFSKEKKQLILCSDYLGSQPLFLYENHDVLFFSSRLEPVLLLPHFSRDLDFSAICDFFAYGLVLENKTFFSEISNIPPRCLLSLTRDGYHLNFYGEHDQESQMLSLDEASDLVFKTIKDSVLRGYERHGIRSSGLTGGADTRLILACLNKDQRAEVNFYTESNNPFHANDNWDVLVAGMLAKNFSLNHQIIETGTASEIRNDNIADCDFIDMPEFKVFDYENWGMKRFQGKFGTEFLGGTIFDLLTLTPSSFDPNDLFQRLQCIFKKNFLCGVEDPVQSLGKSLLQFDGHCLDYDFGITTMMRSFYTNYYSPHDWSWLSPFHFAHNEYYSPFLDIDLICILRTLPREYVSGYRLYAHMYRKYLSEYMKIPFHSMMTNAVAGIPSIQPVLQKFSTVKVSNGISRHQRYAAKMLQEGRLEKFSFFNMDALSREIKRENQRYVIPIVNFMLWIETYL